MANNQAFKIKNGLSAKRYLQNSTAVSASDVDLSTGSYFTKTLSANTTFTFSNPPASGKAMGFALEVSGANVTVGYDLASGAYDSVSKDLGALISPAFLGMHGLFFKPDGTKMFITNLDAVGVEEFDLSTAWDITSATYSSNKFSVSSQDSSPRGLWFKPEGDKMYVGGITNDRIYEYDLSTAWDVTSATFNDYISIASKHTNSKGFAFNNDGTKMYTLGASSNYMNEWTLSTAWDVTTATYSQQFDTSSQAAADNNLTWNNDGTKLFIAESSNDRIHQYSLTTAFDISTMSYDSLYIAVGSQNLFPSAIQFNDDGTKLFMVGTSNGSIYQYSTSSTSTATTTWPSSVKWSGATAPDAPASGEKDVYVFVTTDGGTTYYGKQAGDAVA